MSVDYAPAMACYRIRVHESRRDKGLIRAVTAWGLAASIINTVVGAGIFTVPAALAASVGVYAPIAFLICAVGIGAVAICFAEGGSRIPTSGGAYGYIEAALGPLPAYVAGTLLWLSDAMASGAIAAALADLVVTLLPKAWAAPVHAAIIVIVIGGVAFVNTGGASRGARLVEGLTVLKLIPLAIFIVAGASAIHRANFVQMAEPSSSGLGRGVLLALFALTGMENAVSASGEVAQPSKTIPRALLMSMLPITLLYIAIQTVTQGVLGSSLAHSAAPLADAMAAIHPVLRILMLAAAAVSMLGFIGSDMLCSPRILFAFAREALLPRVLGRVHPRTHAPHMAIAFYAVVAMALGVTGTFAELAVLGTLASAVVYILGCVAAWRLVSHGVATAGPPLDFKWIGTAMAIGIGTMLIMIALASRAEILGLLGAIAVSALIYLVLDRVRKAALALTG